MTPCPRCDVPLFTRLLVCLLVGAAPAWAEPGLSATAAASPSPTVEAVAVAAALSPSAGLLTLEEALKTAKQRSPDIQGMTHQALAVEAQARQALAPQDPTVSSSYNDMNQAFDWQTAGGSTLGISQSFNFPGESLLNFSALMDQARSLRAQLKATSLQLAANVRSAYYSLALARVNIRLNKEQEAVLEQIVSVVKRRYEAGAVTEVDVANAQMAQYQNQQALADLVLAERSAQCQLNVMLGRGAEEPLEVEPLPDFRALPGVDRDAALAALKRSNPQIQSQAFLASQAGKNLTLAWMGLLPSFQVGVQTNVYYPNNYDYANSPDIQTHGLNLAATVPLWFLLNESQAIVSSRHSKAAALASLQSQTEQAVTALFTAIDTLEDDTAKLGLYQSHLLPLSQLTLKLALTNYGTGKIQFQDLAAAAAGLWGNRSAYYTLLQGYLAEYTQYGQLVGEER